MISCLFYIELVAAPMFYSSPEIVHVRLLCRLPPGLETMKFVGFLNLQGIQIQYRGAELEWSIDSLVTTAALARCGRGETFCRVLELQVAAMDTKLDLWLSGDSIGRQSVSNCPYRVDQLVQDQGLDCVFGRRDHQVVRQAEGTAGSDLAAQIEELSEELGRFLPSGSVL